MRRAPWSTRYGFYLVTIASAFSLGNLWRFPFVVEYNNGAPFVLLYIFCVLVIGLPVVIAELMLGKAYQQSLTGAMAELSHESLAQTIVKRSKLWVGVGKLATYASVLLLAYYAVISGWVLFFLMQFIFGLFKEKFIGGSQMLEYLTSNGPLQVGLTSVHILLTSLAVSKGVRVGLEKALAWIMPVFLVLIVFLVVKSLSLSGAVDAIRYLFYPNFSKLTTGTLAQVIGHVFFTLSIGMGTIVVFGSSLKETSKVTHESFRMVLLDTMVSLFVALIIFPILFTSGKMENQGPSLMFRSLPMLFKEFDLQIPIGIVFFFCLYVASLASSIGLLESSVSNLVDRHKFSRVRATQRMGWIAFLIAILPALSSNYLKDIKVAKVSILVLFDYLVVNWVLPLVALGISIAVGFGMKSKLKKEFFIDKDQPESRALYRDWIILIRWFVPFFIIIAVTINILGLW